ncbi:hypothetical protein FOL47_006486 [Perkinsus chesapeaki]|uniref:Protein kinase domain-containing protein n=1 Tax=Perkinsus chesapeaki TaxID=330153 RepID=A0A7J6LS37_PERCH|nr:hypothetical protein FOL47_006486 [Perkinsus chesapeaki]
MVDSGKTSAWAGGAKGTVKRSRIWLTKRNREAGSKRVNNYRGFHKIHTGIYGQKVKTCFLVKRGSPCRRMVIKQYSRATMARQRLPVYGKRGSVTLVTGTTLIEDEIRILERIRHKGVPHVVHLHEILSSPTEDHIILAFEYGGSQIMQYAYGRPLDYVASSSSTPCNLSGEFSPVVYDAEKALAPELLRQLLSAVSKLHSIGIVHKDIKPDNILIKGPDWSWGLKDLNNTTPDGGDTPSYASMPSLTLCDFNSAVQKEDPADMEIYDALGTTAFSPPEVFFGKDPVTGGVCGKARDVWSIGVTFFTMITGKLPWRPSQAEGSPSGNLSLQLAILNDPLKLPDDCPQAALELLKVLLTKDPKSRITTADALSHQWLVDMSAGPLPLSGLTGVSSVLEKYSSLADICKLPIAKKLPNLWKHCILVDWIGPPTHADMDRPYPEGTLGAVYNTKYGEAGFTARGYFPKPLWNSPSTRLWVREHAMDWLGMQPDEPNHHGPLQRNLLWPFPS